MNIFQLIMRTIQFIWILIITALIGNVLAGKTETNSAVNYSMFVAAFCWVVWFYGIAAVFIESIAIPLLLIILDTLCTIFTFVAGVVLAAKLDGAHSCSNTVSLPPSPVSHTVSIERTADTTRPTPTPTPSRAGGTAPTNAAASCRPPAPSSGSSSRPLSAPSSPRPWAAWVAASVA